MHARRVLPCFLIWLGCAGAALALHVDLTQVPELLHAGKLDEARRAIDASGADETEQAIWLARVHHARNEHDQAVKLAKLATESHADESDAHVSLALALRGKMLASSKLRAIGMIGGYKRAMRRALELAPDNLDAREEQIGYFTWAPGFVGGDKQRALELARELRGLDPERGMAIELEVLDALERDDDAIALAREILERYPDNSRARWRYARRLQDAERWAEADPHFSTLADSDEPAWALNGLYQLGRSRVLGGYGLEAAVAHFERYLRERQELQGIPGADGAHWRLGMALEALGRHEPALAHYREAVELNPELDPAKKAAKRLERRPAVERRD